MNRVFVISDHHFGHQKIIDFESRPFASAEEMDDYMIRQWNAVVAKNDRVFHLGDFSFYNKEKTKAIVEQLNGQKFLILATMTGGGAKLGGWMPVLTRSANILSSTNPSTFCHTNLST